MKTSELIEELRRLDPSGEMECVTGSRTPKPRNHPAYRHKKSGHVMFRLLPFGHAEQEPTNVIVL